MKYQVYIWQVNKHLEAYSLHPTTGLVTQWTTELKNKPRIFYERKIIQFITDTLWIINHFELKNGEEKELDRLINCYFRQHKGKPIEKSSKDYDKIDRNLEIIYQSPFPTETY